MHRSLLLLILLLLAGINKNAYSQQIARPVYVLVHGAWGGSWAFKQVDSLLTAKGCTVYRPSLTGQGERVHLAAPTVGLDTHIKDVVNMLLYEALTNVILVGHSYGGMVVTGVADSLPQRIKQLVYLDAFVPDNGESALTLLGSDSTWFTKMIVNGFAIPAWVPKGKMPPKDVPHAAKTFSDKIVLKNDLRLNIPTTYILTVEKGKKEEDDDFTSQAVKAKQKGWPILQLASDHNPQWSAPEALVDMLFNIANK
jgi:pimeloyl-ACP methyl ester carboxylesterase